MKRIGTAIMALALLAVPATAEQVLFGGLASVSIDDDDTELDMDGLYAEYLYFGEDNNLFIGAIATTVQGIDDICIYTVAAGSCFDIETTTSGIGLAVGYDFDDNPFTPFASISFSESDVEFEFPETDVKISNTTEETSLAIGTHIGDVGRRLSISLDGIDDDNQSLTVGGYYTMDNNFVLAGSLGSPVDNIGDTWSMVLGVGWSF